MFDRVRELNRALDAGDLTTVRALRADLARVAAVLGVLASVRPPCWTISATRGRRARASRHRDRGCHRGPNPARQRKDFREADAIRTRLKDQGILLEGHPLGHSVEAG